MDVYNYYTPTTANGSDGLSLLHAGQNHIYLPVAIPISLVALVLIISIVLGNVLVIMTLTLDKNVKGSNKNRYLLSLAVADLMVGVLIVPFSALKLILGYWPLGTIFCDIYLSLDVMACTASILSLCAISIDRYKLVTDYTYEKSKWHTGKAVIYFIGGVWSLSAIISIVPLFGWKEKIKDNSSLESPQCEVNPNTSYILFSTIGSFFLPAIVMVILYIIILKVARERANVKETSSTLPSKKRCVRPGGAKGKIVVSYSCHNGNSDPSSDSNANKSETTSDEPNVSLNMPATATKNQLVNDNKKQKIKRNLQRRKRATLILGLIIGTFLLCWLPFFVSYIISAWCSECVHPTVFIVFTWIGYLNSALNPIIYGFANRNFRKSFKRYLTCKWR